ncbi:MAG: hypothetical protein A3F09_01840 [Chlamydiae bacterium RIFCSPHIGHO2_12_FULL_49_11]|nr:MAG: hypothetical protein A3F09_01840 [Chlamydiae bacterium RIFCSPHIGHO2_12_FULL_49_11]
MKPVTEVYRERVLEISPEQNELDILKRRVDELVKANAGLMSENQAMRKNLTELDTAFHLLKEEVGRVGSQVLVHCHSVPLPSGNIATSRAHL